MSEDQDKPYEYGPHSVGPMPAPGLRLGSGRVSAYLSAFLGPLSLLGVLCFRFPEYLTTPELRDVYEIDTLRTILKIAISAALVLGVVSLAWSREHVRIASAGLLTTGLAIVLGGYHVQGRAVHQG